MRLPRYVLLLAMSAPLVQAGSGTSQVIVRARYVQAAVLEVPQLQLRQDPAGAEGALQAQSLRLRLPADAPFRLALDAGQQAQSQQRRMVHRDDSESFLPYELFQDAAGQQPWGEDAGEGSAVPGRPLRGVGTGQLQSLTVWARLPQSLRGARPGDYHDAVTISLSY